MKIPLLSALLELFKPRILSLDEALARVAEIGDYVDRVASRPVASLEVPHDKLHQYGIASLLDEMSPDSKRDRPASIKFSDGAVSFARIHWTRRASGFDLGRNVVRIYDNPDLSLEMFLLDVLGQAAHELVRYLAEDADRRMRRHTAKVVKALGARLDAAFSKLVRGLCDESSRQTHDPVLPAASAAAQCVAAMIDIERPGMTKVVNAVLDQRRFETRVFVDDVFGTPVRVDGPEHLRVLLPGDPITVATSTTLLGIFSVRFDDSLVRAPDLPGDAIGMARLARRHGDGTSYGEAIDEPFKRATR